MSELPELTSPETTPALHGVAPPATSHILIVDDEQLNLDMLSRRLQRSGFTVSVASTGRKAIAEVAAKPFDLVLLDQMMPGMSGSEVLRHWREQYSPEQLPVVMVTAVAESDKIASALEAGANDYITKPIDYQVALARIRVQLSRKKAEAALRLSEERYALAAQASRDGLWDWDLATNMVYYSPRWLEIMGLTEAPANPNEQLWFEHILPADQDEVTSELELIRHGASDVLHCSYRVLHPDGTLRWMSCRAVATRDNAGKLVRLAGSQSDVTEEKTRDALTGLANRTLLLSYLGLACSEGSISHAVLFIDLDKFKVVNDSLGHLAGDDLLRQVANRLKEVTAQYAPVGSESICARMGGDEFALLLRSNADLTSTQPLVQALQATMKKPFRLEGRQLHCAFSIGVSYYTPAQEGAEDMLREADAALYAAKARGRGCAVVFDPSLFAQAQERFELENDLRGAIERNELEVFYQAKADLKSCHLYGVEALLRWRHPRRGLISPGLFIPIAEENGTIVEIGHWILHEACAQVKLWHDQTPDGPLLELSVNLSPREFRQQNLVAGVAHVLETTGFPASCLHLEITEGVLFEDIDAAAQVLRSLKDLGVRLDLDDFGSGYSSFRYLRQLPFDLIKIDREFTFALNPDEPSSEQLIRTIVSMGETLGMKVLAEGVETEPHRSTLQRLGCKLGQGFYFSRPIEAGQMKTLLEGNASRSMEDAA
ncbi:PAS domain S-box-containing protein/diguanylate cyclase (GGDEF) domain-containing protein [Bryocella elongata]|uniref:PAS domain S-box-containing protein/diguanylate cyclase (GGDEF) domain-containing protein n=1 Tax=Bryocella elongata TaxID=863522 RepID=A0A1H5ZLP0_9BACT|nr:EAL domain-containing protein [Bryocella elongata]SEG36924.1 PAS domain S-box-containing protein/diguanylate cyclase (GGDEF) domain-containing protein [Bryocella elongata]